MALGSTGFGPEKRCRRGESSVCRSCHAASGWAAPGRRFMAIAMGGGGTGGARRGRGGRTSRVLTGRGPPRADERPSGSPFRQTATPAAGVPFGAGLPTDVSPGIFPRRAGWAFSRSDDLRAMLCRRHAGLALEPGREIGSVTEAAVKRHRDDGVGRRRKQVHRALEGQIALELVR